MRPEEFIEFFKFLSPTFQKDKDFRDFIQNSFRYNELRNLQRFNQKS